MSEEMKKEETSETEQQSELSDEQLEEAAGGGIIKDNPPAAEMEAAYNPMSQGGLSRTGSDRDGFGMEKSDEDDELPSLEGLRPPD